MILQKSIKVNSIEDIEKKVNEVNVLGFICPKCKGHEFNYYGSYSRFLIVKINEEILEITIKIKRIRCKTCKSTHAVIPDFIVPYKAYSFEIVNKILYLKENKEKTNKEIEEEYKVSRQLIRKWQQEFEKIKSKIKIIVKEMKNLLELEMKKYYEEYLEIYMMRRAGNYNYTST